MTTTVEQFARIIGDAAAIIAGASPPVPIAREGADTRARIPVPIPQATGLDLVPRGVWVRALSAAARLEAEVLAHQWVARKLGPSPDNHAQREVYLIAYEALLGGRIVIEEAARMIVEPPDMPASIVEGWGDAVIQTIHAAGVGAERHPAELIAAEIARAHRGAIPPPPDRGEGGDYPFAVGLDSDPGRADGDATGRTGGPADGDAV